METNRKVNWTKEEEYTLIEAIQAAGDVLRGTGQSADMNKKKTRLWNDVINTINSIHGNNRDVKEVKKKWNNLKGSAKVCVNCSRREARRTGGGPNEARKVEDEDILILSSDKEMSTSVTERVSQMLSSTPTFTRNKRERRSVPSPTTLLPPQTEVIEASDVIPVFQGPEGNGDSKWTVREPWTIRESQIEQTYL